MIVHPGLAEFAAAHGRGERQPVWTHLPADLETPVAAMLKLGGDSAAYSFLLESVEGGAARGRFSVIGMTPDIVWRTRGDAAEINADHAADSAAFVPQPDGAMASLRRLLAASRLTLPPALPPMALGVFGYLGYDMVRLVERLPDAPEDTLGVPDGLMLRPTVMVIFDSVSDEMSIVIAASPRAGMSAEECYRAATARIAEVADRLAAAVPAPHAPPRVAAPPPPAREHDTGASNMSTAEYCAMVRRAKDYIGAGDIFQVVLSQRFSMPYAAAPFALYRALRRVNPSPYLYYFDCDAFHIAGSSPEILVKLRGGRVVIRPIAGTRPRGGDAAEDARLAAELLADEKERAEHLMLVDLGRNDAARVTQPGSVQVTDSFFLERYTHVMHIASNVEGRVAEGRDGLDCIAAGFPAGTVSGAPKIRAMQIIDLLEPVKRGLYAGAIGYFAPDGSMDSCIALRTALVKDGVMHVQAGAGIVADSVPELEERECRAKAAAVFRAAAESGRFAAGDAPGAAA